MSYAKIPASRVIDACASYMAERNSRIQKAVDEAIEKARHVRTVFGSTVLSTKDARGRIEEHIEFLQMEGKYWSNQVEDLFRLANAANAIDADGFVNLSTDHARVLGRHLLRPDL